MPRNNDHVAPTPLNEGIQIRISITTNMMANDALGHANKETRASILLQVPVRNVERAK